MEIPGGRGYLTDIPDDVPLADARKYITRNFLQSPMLKPATESSGVPVATEAPKVAEPIPQRPQPLAEQPQPSTGEILKGMVLGGPELPKFKHTVDEGVISSAAKEIANVLIGIPEFTLSPLGAVTMATAGVAPAVVAGGFAGTMAVQSGMKARELAETWKNLTPAEKARSVVDLGATMAFTALPAAGLAGVKALPEYQRGIDRAYTGKDIRLKPGEAPPPKPIERLAPETAKALEETSKVAQVEETPKVGPELETIQPRPPTEDYVEPEPTELLVKREEFETRPIEPEITPEPLSPGTEGTTLKTPEQQPVSVPGEVTPEPPPSPAKAKEPWEMNKAEWHDAEVAFYEENQKTFTPWYSSRYMQGSEARHKSFVKKAIREGKPVPPEVLSEYPDLAPKTVTPEPKPVVETGGTRELTVQTQTARSLPPDTKVIPPNSTFIKVVNYDGKTVGVVAFPHDGTPEGIREANRQAEKYVNQNYAWKDEFYNTNSQRGATDENGIVKWVVSPNGRLSEIGTPDAAYTLGDLKAYDKAAAKAALDARNRGDMVEMNRILDGKASEYDRKAAEHAGYAENFGKEVEDAIRKQKSGESVKTVDDRFSNWNDYLKHLRGHEEWQRQISLEYAAEAEKWRGPKVKEVKTPTSGPSEVAFVPTLERAKQMLTTASKLLTDSRLNYIIGEPREKIIAKKYPKRKMEIIQQYWDALDAVDAAEKQAKAPTNETEKTEIIGMGGAVPSEFEPPRGTPTSNKNAVVDAERVRRGLQPMMAPMKRDWGTAWDMAMAKIDQDPSIQDRLITELIQKPRPTSDVENAMLDHRRVDLRNEYEKSARDAAQAYDDGRQQDLLEANARTEMWNQKLIELEKAAGKGGAGTELGRGLASRKRMTNEDFTMASLELKMRAERGGASITDTERANLRKIADDYKAKSEALEKQLKISEEENRKKAADLAFAQAKLEASKQPLYAPAVLQAAEKFVSKMETQSKIYLKELLGATWSPTPEMLYKAAYIGATKIARGSLELAKWTDEMVKDLGEKFRPYAKQVWDMAKQQLDAELTKFESQPKSPKITKAVKKAEEADQIEINRGKIVDKVAKGEMDKIAYYAKKLQRIFIQKGITDREKNTDAVHQVLEEVVPDWTRTDTVDAVSGYGKFRQLSKDEISIQIRAINGELQQLRKLEDMAAGIPPAKTGLERRTPTEEERRLIKLVNEAKFNFQVPITDPATQLKSALDTRKTQLRNRAADLKDRLNRKDFSDRPKRELQLDPEALKLSYELDKIKREFNQQLVAYRMAHRPLSKKIVGSVAEVFNTFRAIMTSFDLSAVLRQGDITVLSHPLLASKAFMPMIRSLKSEQARFAVDESIRLRKNYPLYKQAKLFLSEHGVGLDKMEEAYMSRWAEKIPGVGASQRAYETFLNKIRADAFDALADQYGFYGKLTPEAAKVLANYVNVNTGRGTIGMKENAATGMNTLFFAPRYVASRFQFILGQPMWHGDAITRRLIAQEYARFLIGASVVYALAKSSGGSIELDPRSSDFGKVKFGNTRLDPMGGLLQTSVLLSRIVSGESKNLKSGVVHPIRGKVPYGAPNTADVMAKFLRTKLAPGPGMFVDVATGTDVIGNKVTPQSLAARSLVPLSLGDIYKAMEEQGIPKGTALGLLAIFGMGLQTFDVYQPKQN